MGAEVIFKYYCAHIYLLFAKRVYKSGIRFCGETDITLNYTYPNKRKLTKIYY